MSAVDRCGAVIRDDKGWSAAEEAEGMCMSVQPTRHLFVQKAFCIEVPAVGQRHNEHVNIHQLSGVRVHKVTQITGLIRLRFHTGRMLHGE